MSSEVAGRVVPSLFDPIALGPVLVPNRVFYAPTSVGYAEDGLLLPAAMEHYGRRASGGAGAVMTEHLAISEEGWQHGRQPAAWPSADFAPGLESLAAVIRSNGAVPIAQISHAGRYAGPWHQWDARHRLAPSPVPVPILGEMKTPTQISVEQIADVVAAFAATTRFLVDLGWQGIEIHGGSGFLLSSFLSPLMNQRTDAYGGSPTGRLRLLLEVLAASQQAAGGQAVVGIHLTTDELVAGGIHPDHVSEMVAPLEAAGAQFFRPGSGTFETLRAPENAGASSGTDFNRPSTDALVAAATVPVLANGGLRTRADAEAALAGGASAVALARPLLADPDWMAKLKDGADDALVICPCSPPMCLQTQLTGAVCASWPEDVRERGYFGFGHAWQHGARVPDAGSRQR